MQQATNSKPVAFVTGASTGFGRNTVETLARAGYRTFAGVRDISGRNAAVAKELSALGIEPVELDVTIDASVDAAAKHVQSVAGTVDMLVNNAGAAYFGLVEAYTPQKVQAQFDVNVFGVLRVNRAFLPAMRERGNGLVVYVSSVVGRFNAPFMGVYAASKHALESLAEATAYELRPSGIDVTIVEPGPYKTNIFNSEIFADDTVRNESYGELANKARELYEAFRPQGGDPQEVADAILEIAQRSNGQRPLRLVVSPVETPTGAINEALAPLQSAVLDWFEAGGLAPKIAHESRVSAVTAAA
jgi:NAD(P)-dependent dehydrogenase (short-subunit alcohol dehydrogenase family)